MSSEILKKPIGAKTEVVAVWFPNLWTDTRYFWPSDALSDPRVVNFWDSDQIAGKWYAANLTHRRSGPEWDTWILYAPGQSFSDPPEAWGHTIVGTRERLRTSLAKVEPSTSTPR